MVKLTTQVKRAKPFLIYKTQAHEEWLWREEAEVQRAEARNSKVDFFFFLHMHNQLGNSAVMT